MAEPWSLHAGKRQQVYTRPEFTSTLAFDVITSTMLLAWWLQHDWTAIQRAFGNPAGTVNNSTAPVAHRSSAAGRRPRARWFQREKPAKP